jgi:hypothetical protein
MPGRSSSAFITVLQPPVFSSRVSLFFLSHIISCLPFLLLLEASRSARRARLAWFWTEDRTTRPEIWSKVNDHSTDLRSWVGNSSLLVFSLVWFVSEKFLVVTSDVLWDVEMIVRILIKKTNYVTRLKTARRIY